MVAIRNEREIDRLREANQIVARVHEALAPLVKPGARTGDLDAVAEQVILMHGGRPSFKGYGKPPFPAATCISVEQEIVHGIPGDRILRAGEIVSIDVGVEYKGYFGDAALTHACGEVDAARQALLDITDLALSRAVRAARHGNTLRDIGRAVERTCATAGFGVVRAFVGHGIGKAMHEEPQVPNFDTGKKGLKLKKGMVLAIEPMVNLGTEDVEVLRDGWTAVTRDGLPSAHFEHSVVVRERGGEILSASSTCVWGQRTD